MLDHDRIGLTLFFVGATLCGLAAGLLIARISEFYTSADHAPVRRLAERAGTGPATVILGGLADGMRSTAATLEAVVEAVYPGLDGPLRKVAVESAHAHIRKLVDEGRAPSTLLNP